MDEADFLARYDASAFERMSVTVDLVLMSVSGGAPAALLMRRDEHPFLGRWALPGGFVGPLKSLDAAARRVLREKAHLESAYVEQLYTFGAADRDPRTRVISVAYFALLPANGFAAALKAAPELTLARISAPPRGGGDVSVEASTLEGTALSLAFDHGDMLALAIRRLRGKLDYSDIAFALLPQVFTLRDLQGVHEAIAGVPVNKSAFRRRMLDTGRLEPTGERETGASFRPAELFRLKTSA